MTISDCYTLGFVSKTQGYKGKVILYLDVDDSMLYKALDSVFIQQDKKLIPFFIEEITILDKGFARVKFQDVDDEESAQRLVKNGLYLPLEQLPDLGPDRFYYHEIIGFEVLDLNQGAIGPVIEIMDIPGNPQVISKHQNETVYIPISDPFYRGIDKSRKELFVELPEGLIEANL